MYTEFDFKNTAIAIFYELESLSTLNYPLNLLYNLVEGLSHIQCFLAQPR